MVLIFYLFYFQVECKKAEPRINPKSLTETLNITKNQNGYIKQLQFGQMMPTQQNNWSPPINQTLFGLQGNYLFKMLKNNYIHAILMGDT